MNIEIRLSPGLQINWFIWLSFKERISFQTYYMYIRFTNEFSMYSQVTLSLVILKNLKAECVIWKILMRHACMYGEIRKQCLECLRDSLALGSHQKCGRESGFNMLWQASLALASLQTWVAIVSSGLRLTQMATSSTSLLKIPWSQLCAQSFNSPLTCWWWQRLI